MSAAIAGSPPRGVLAYNASKIGMLQSCLSSLDSSLGTVPNLIRDIEEGECWRIFKFPDSDIVRWNAAEFRRFVEAPRPRGCETPIHVLEQALRGTDAWEVFLRLTRGAPGNPTGANQYTQGIRDIVTDSTEAPATIPISPEVPRPRQRDYSREAATGNSTSYTLRRLERSAPELLERVRTGELTPHGAAVKAGLAEPKITVPKHPERAARVLGRHFTGDRLNLLIEALERIARAAADQPE